jgi:hypothetical protein
MYVLEGECYDSGPPNDFLKRRPIWQQILNN